MSKQKPSGLAVLTALIFAPLIHGAVYKWLDEQSATHFPDAPSIGGQTVRERTFHQPEQARAWP